ncbi:citrate-proton symporter [Salmonella enterica subsp. enterica]|uniref:Citrate-proton symporter n=1 Tax=Salmonella enterica I TaxID=59201 RepID=A0A447MW41_SALET|nr:citrate-proton symporter [Salmonella enterica subsp. enterica]
MAQHTPATSRAGTFGAILRVTSGNFLEQFDFFLFGFYATYIARTFFPAESEFASLMLTFAVFGSGFLMRPVGAIVLGAYIDRIGRRKGLDGDTGDYGLRYVAHRPRPRLPNDRPGSACVGAVGPVITRIFCGR